MEETARWNLFCRHYRKTHLINVVAQGQALIARAINAEGDRNHPKFTNDGVDHKSPRVSTLESRT